MDARISLSIRFDNRRGAIGRAIVADHQLEVPIRLPKDAFNGLANIILIIVMRDEHGDERTLGQRAKANWLQQAFDSFSVFDGHSLFPRWDDGPTAIRPALTRHLV